NVPLQQPSARLLIGSGKVEELRQLVLSEQADLVIFNHALTASQERNLENALECRVLDRVGLILDIFAQRAQTYEGKLQVELAQLEHLSTRLVRSRTDLSRQQGGIACAVRVKPSWKRIDVYCVYGSDKSKPVLKKCAVSVNWRAAVDSGLTYPACP